MPSEDDTSTQTRFKRLRVIDNDPDVLQNASTDYFNGSNMVWRESKAEFAARMAAQAQVATEEGEKWLKDKVKEREKFWEGIEFGYAAPPEERLTIYCSKCFFWYCSLI